MDEIESNTIDVAGRLRRCLWTHRSIISFFLCVREDRHGLQECRIKISRSNGNETRVGSSHLSARKRPTGNFPTIPRGLSSSTAAFFCFFEKRTTEKKRDDRVYYNYQQKSKNKDTTTTLGVPVWSRMLMRTHRYSKW